MIIICDSSPLIALSIMNQLGLLDTLFGEVYVPQAVFDEVTINGKFQSSQIQDWAKDKIIAAKDEPLKKTFELLLGEGESEAMAIYFEKKADYLLIDEKKGRKIAAYHKIQIIGTLGILLISKEKGLINSVLPLLNLLQQSYIRISDELYRKTLELAGETENLQ